MRRLAVAFTVFFAIAAFTPGTTEAAVSDASFTETGCENYSDSVARLYTAGLDRPPEQGGFEFWMGEYVAGRWGLPRMAAFFAASPEFADSYGTLTQDGFIRQLYRNVLGREGEQSGVTFWNGQMSQGMDRGTVMLRFAESPENIERSETAPPALGPFNAGVDGALPCPTWAPTPTGATPDDGLGLGSTVSFEYGFPVAGLDVSMLAIVEGQVSGGGEDHQGRCLFVLGTLTPTSLAQGNVSRPDSSPEISVIAGGQSVGSSSSICQSREVKAAGWGQADLMGTTLGTPYPFFVEIFLSEDGPQTPTALVLGNPAAGNEVYFEAAATIAVPNAPTPASGPNEFLSDRPGLGTDFEITPELSDLAWEGQITDVVEADPADGIPGTCMFVLGQIAATEVAANGDAPLVSILNRGWVPSNLPSLFCDPSAVEGAGWESILDADASSTAPFPFYATTYLAQSDAIDIQAVVVGTPSSSGALFFQVASVSSEFPVAPR